MIKTTAPCGDEESALPIRRASQGLLGIDYQNIQKRAGEKFAARIKSLEFHPGEYPVHLIAVGATETYGSNRNGDGFPKVACQKYHPTFVKFARWYRHHINKDPALSYGRVVASEFNDKMQRIELVVGLNGTKEAAERNGGLIADDELNDLESSKDLPVSMSCRVPFDICSGCGNKAARPANYCTGATCKLGGLKSHMGRMVKDGSILHAINTEPMFFDISRVRRPADRIAWTTGVLKEASAASEEFELDWYKVLDNPIVESQVEVTIKLAALDMHDGSPVTDYVLCGDSLPNDLTPSPALFSALADAKVSLTPEAWLSLMNSDSVHNKFAAQALRGALPGVFRRLAASPHLQTLLAENPYITTASYDYPHKKAADNLKKDFGLSDHDMLARGIRNRVVGRSATNYTVAPSEVGAVLAEEYALYKIALADSLKSRGDGDRCLHVLVRQNYVR